MDKRPPEVHPHHLGTIDANLHIHRGRAGKSTGHTWARHQVSIPRHTRLPPPYVVLQNACNISTFYVSVLDSLPPRARHLCIYLYTHRKVTFSNADIYVEDGTAAPLTKAIVADAVVPTLLSSTFKVHEG